MPERPRCNETPPPATGGKALLERLLAIELERLDVAVRIERERNIVFPETSVIIHDIQRLNESLDQVPEKPSKRALKANQFREMLSRQARAS